MTEPAARNASHGSGWMSGRTFWMSLAGILVVGLILANAHLVLVAVKSQPDCVPHDKVADGTTVQMRAARSGC